MVHLQLSQNPSHLHRMRDEGLPALPLLLNVCIVPQRKGFSNLCPVLLGKVTQLWLQPLFPQILLINIAVC